MPPQLRNRAVSVGDAGAEPSDDELALLGGLDDASNSEHLVEGEDQDSPEAAEVVDNAANDMDVDEGDAISYGEPTPSPSPLPSPARRSFPHVMSSPVDNHIMNSLLDRLEARRPEPESKGIDVRHPDKFTGRKREKLNSFLLHCKMVFRGCEAKYSTDAKKVAYASQHLDDLAVEWFHSGLLVDPEPSWTTSWRDFQSEIRMRFGEMHSQVVHASKLAELRMGDKMRLSEYITRFTTHSSQLAWSDDALIHNFRRGLSPKFFDYLPLLESTLKPQTLHDWFALATKIDEVMYQQLLAQRPLKLVDRHEKNKSGEKSTDPRRNHKKDKDGSDRSKDSSSKDKSNKNKNFKPKSKLSLELTKDGHLPTNERQRRIDNNLCLYCGAKDHKVAECKVKDGKPKTSSSKPTFSIKNKIEEIPEGKD